MRVRIQGWRYCQIFDICQSYRQNNLNWLPNYRNFGTRVHVSAAITCFAFIVVLLDKLVVPILRDFDLTYAPSSRWTSGFFWQPCPAARAQRARPAPTLARSVRQVDFVICLYTTLPVRGEVCTTHAHGYLARRSAPIDVESLRYFTAIFVMNLDLLCLWNAARNLFYRQI